MKQLLIIFLALFYCLFSSYVMYYIGHNIVEVRIIALLTHIPILLVMACRFYLGNFTKNSYIDDQLYQIIDFMLICFMVLYCLNNKGIMGGVTNKLLFFNGLNVAFILIVLTSGFRHGIFKKRE